MYESTREIGERLAAEAQNLPPRVTYAQHHDAMALKRRLARGMSWQQVRRWLEAHSLTEFDD